MQIPTLAKIIEVTHKALSARIDEHDLKAWTAHVARKLASLCPVGCLPYGHLFREDDRREYLCDQVWGIERPDDWEHYEGLAFAMECEWDGGVDAFLEDFVKVLDVAAERRLFIGNLHTKTAWPDRQTTVLETVRQIAKGHRFFGEADEVAVFLCEKGGDGDVECWLVRGNGDKPVLVPDKRA